MLFDTTPPTRPLTNKVFSTEGHPLHLPYQLLQKSSSSSSSSSPPSGTPGKAQTKGQDLFCPVYTPPTLGGGLVVGIEQRTDYEYARSLVFGPGVEGRVEERKAGVIAGRGGEGGGVWWWEGGWCEVPKAPRFVSSRATICCRRQFVYYRLSSCPVSATSLNHPPATRPICGSVGCLRPWTHAI
jgi:mannosidase alpha-like ER degradation enhancer 1